MQTAEETVIAFITSWGESKEEMVSGAIRRYFTEDTEWDTKGFAKIKGIEAAIAVMEAFVARIPVDRVPADILNIVSQGDVVLLERLEHFIDAKGKEFMTLPAMATFRIKDGKIATWNDYFDRATLEKGATG